MAIGALTTGNQAGKAATKPMRATLFAFTGDTSYPTGGTPAFEDTVQAKLGETFTVLAVLGQDCGGYVPVYDRANDKLMVYEEGADGGAADEVGDTTALNGTTFNVLVIGY